ncbi:hypothetical protein Dimus_017869 [Dionaea muscipula]
MVRERNGSTRDEGSWTTMLHKIYNRNYSMNRGRGGKMITLFVEDLPDVMDQNAMFKLFTKFRVARHVYLPRKRSKTWKRFGFVRFDCKVAAENKELRVKIADFHRNQGNMTTHRNQGNMMTQRRNRKIVLPGRREANLTTVADQPQSLKCPDQKLFNSSSYANVVKRRTVPNKGLSSVKGASIGNGWLHRGAVASLCDYRASDFLIESFMLKGVGNAKVKRMGNKQVSLTFQTEDLMTQFIEDHNRNSSQWFISVSHWSVNSNCSFGREVWLNCYGIIIHAWNSSTFTAIGQHWGDVTHIEEDTVNAIHFDVGKVKFFINNPGVINHNMQLLVGFKLFVIRVAEE